MFSNRLAKLMLLLVLLSTGIADGATKARKFPKGTWGGDQISVSVEANTAIIEYSCARGTIKGPLVLDSKGKFKLTGTHTAQRGGPIRSDEATNARPAVYTGNIDGKTMTLTVRYADTKEVIGTFKLVLGQEGRLFRCM